MKTDPIMYIQGAILRMAQEKYAEALRKGDRETMLDQARFLFRNYTACGNKILAGKWTEEYIRCWLNREDEPPQTDHTAPPSDPVLSVGKTFSGATGF